MLKARLRGTSGSGRGKGVSPALFSKLKKMPDFSKNTRIIFIYSFVCCRLNVYRSAQVLRNLPCTEKFLVTHLGLSGRRWKILNQNSGKNGRSKKRWSRKYCSFKDDVFISAGNKLYFRNIQKLTPQNLLRPYLDL